MMFSRYYAPQSNVAILHPYFLSSLDCHSCIRVQVNTITLNHCDGMVTSSVTRSCIESLVVSLVWVNSRTHACRTMARDGLSLIFHVVTFSLAGSAKKREHGARSLLIM